jgi:hypothetical protein
MSVIPFPGADRDRFATPFSFQERAILDFTTVVGIEWPAEFRLITRAHVIDWRKDFERR